MTRITDPFVRARIQRYLFLAAGHLGAAVQAVDRGDADRFLEHTWLLLSTIAVARAALTETAEQP